MTSRLLLADRRRHLAPFPSSRVKMCGAELSRGFPHCPGAARLAIPAPCQASALILAALIRRPALKKKTEVESKIAHCQRPRLIMAELVAVAIVPAVSPLLINGVAARFNCAVCTPPSPEHPRRRPHARNGRTRRPGSPATGAALSPGCLGPLRAPICPRRQDISAAHLTQIAHFSPSSAS